MYSGESCSNRAKWLFSGNVVVFEQKGFYSDKSGCTRGKEVVFGKTGCIRAKVVVFQQMWLYSGKVVVFREK